jgi:hypothetical protein
VQPKEGPTQEVLVTGKEVARIIESHVTSNPRNDTTNPIKELTMMRSPGKSAAKPWVGIGRLFVVFL